MNRVWIGNQADIINLVFSSAQYLSLRYKEDIEIVKT